MRLPQQIQTLGICLITALGACQPSTGEKTPGYQQLHAEIFSKSCASGACHGGPVGIAGLSFEDPSIAYERLIGGVPALGTAALRGLQLVVPGKPEQSLLYMKIDRQTLDTELGTPMPLSTGYRLGPKSREAIRQWILAGAPYDGAHFLADTEPLDASESYVACEANDEEGLRACFEPNPDPSTYVRFYTPPMVIPASSERLVCSFLDAPTEDIRLRAIRAQQMAGGHHSAVFVGLTGAPDTNPIDCSEVGMGSLRFVISGGGAGGVETALPAETALTIRKGQRIVIQSHYINATTQDVTVMDAVDLERTDTMKSPINLDPLIVMDSDFSVPSGAVDYTRVKECLITEPMTLHMMLGHTHDYGVLFELSILRKAGSDDPMEETFYHATDGPTLRDNPEILFFDDAPITVEAGDIIRVTCGWTNTTDHALGWPEEMCVGLMYYGPGRGTLNCDTEDISPEVQDGGTVEEGCASPSDLGNELGVGKYCEKGGSQCDDTPEPTLCLEEFDAEMNICSVILCSEDSECGPGASCVFSGAGSACIPKHCQ